MEKGIALESLFLIDIGGCSSKNRSFVGSFVVRMASAYRIDILLVIDVVLDEPIKGILDSLPFYIVCKYVFSSFL